MEGRHFDDFFSQDFSHFALLRLLCSLHDYHLTSLSSRSDLRSRDRKSDGSFFFLIESETANRHLSGVRYHGDGGYSKYSGIIVFR